MGHWKNCSRPGFAQVYSDAIKSPQFLAIYRQCKDVLLVYVKLRLELRKNKKRDQKKGNVFRNNGELRLPFAQLAAYMAPATAAKAFDLLERAGFIECVKRGHWPKTPSEYGTSEKWRSVDPASVASDSEPHRLRGRALDLHNNKVTNSKRARTQNRVVDSRSTSAVEAMKSPQNPKTTSTVEARAACIASTVEATQLQRLKEEIPSDQPVEVAR